MNNALRFAVHAKWKCRNGAFVDPIIITIIIITVLIRNGIVHDGGLVGDWGYEVYWLLSYYNTEYATILGKFIQSINNIEWPLNYVCVRTFLSLQCWVFFSISCSTSFVWTNNDNFFFNTCVYFGRVCFSIHFIFY